MLDTPQLDNSKYDLQRNPGHKHNVQVTQKGATHNARKEHPEEHPCVEQNHALPQVGQKAKTKHPFHLKREIMRFISDDKESHTDVALSSAALALGSNNLRLSQMLSVYNMTTKRHILLRIRWTLEGVPNASQALLLYLPLRVGSLVMMRELCWHSPLGWVVLVLLIARLFLILNLLLLKRLPLPWWTLAPAMVYVGPLWMFLSTTDQTAQLPESYGR